MLWGMKTLENIESWLDHGVRDWLRRWASANTKLIRQQPSRSLRRLKRSKKPGKGAKKSRTAEKLQNISQSHLIKKTDRHLAEKRKLMIKQDPAKILHLKNNQRTIFSNASKIIEKLKQLKEAEKDSLSIITSLRQMEQCKWNFFFKRQIFLIILWF